MRFKLTSEILEIILISAIGITLGFVLFSKDEPIKVNEPQLENFDEYPLTAWQTLDRKGGECVKIKYRVQKNKTRLYMYNTQGKKVHQQQISLVIVEDQFIDGLLIENNMSTLEYHHEYQFNQWDSQLTL